MKIKNKELLKRILEVSITTGLILTTFAGCANDLEKQMTKEVDPEDPSLITYEEIEDYRYYILCIQEKKNEEKIYITKIPSFISIDNLGNGLYMYYYRSVDSEENMGSILYNSFDHTFISNTGPNIIYAICLTDYIDEYHVKKDEYNQEDQKAIYNQIKKDFQENNLENFDKQKIYLKKNNL